MNDPMRIHNDRHQWFIDRDGTIVWPVRTKCQCLDCVNGYINGIIIQNRFNADGLWAIETESEESEKQDNIDFPIKYFDTWQERNAWEVKYYNESNRKVVERINEIARKMKAGKIKKKKQSPIQNDGMKQNRNDKCACNSGKKFKNCCLAEQMKAKFLNPHPN